MFNQMLGAIALTFDRVLRYHNSFISKLEKLEVLKVRCEVSSN